MCKGSENAARLFALTTLVLGLAAAGCRGKGPGVPATAPTLTVDREARTVTVQATVHAGQFPGEPNPAYHLVIWEHGKLAENGLFVTPTSDKEVLDALISLGGVPGDNLTQETWDERFDPGKLEPDKLAEGTEVEVLVQWPELTEPMPVAELFEPGPGVRMSWRLAGNEKLISAWKSGCVVCMYSCPGSKVANAELSVRDYMQDLRRFALRAGVLPPDGTQATVTFRLLE